MKNYAIVKNGIVENIIVCDKNYLPDDGIAYYDSNPAVIGGEYSDGYFYSLQPFPSWIKDGLGNWIAPVNKPDDGKTYVWNEETQNWDRLILDWDPSTH